VWVFAFALLVGALAGLLCAWGIAEGGEVVGSLFVRRSARSRAWEATSRGSLMAGQFPPAALPNQAQLLLEA
jgi:hypothetical protein